MGNNFQISGKKIGKSNEIPVENNEIRTINSINKLPIEILDIIILYFLEKNKYYTTKEIKHESKCRLNLYLGLCNKNVNLDIENLENIFNLLKKYYDYQVYYEKDIDILTKFYETKSNFSYIEESILKRKKTPPILIDLLCTGCNLPYADSSFNIFDEKIEYDLYNIVKLIPGTINSKAGVLRCRQYVSPLYLACINTAIPIRIIKYLISKGCNTSDKLMLNGAEVSILDDLYDNIDIYRYNQIKTIFECQNL